MLSPICAPWACTRVYVRLCVFFHSSLLFHSTLFLEVIIFPPDPSSNFIFFYFYFYFFFFLFFYGSTLILFLLTLISYKIDNIFEDTTYFSSFAATATISKLFFSNSTGHKNFFFFNIQSPQGEINTTPPEPYAQRKTWPDTHTTATVKHHYRAGATRPQPEGREDASPA